MEEQGYLTAEQAAEARAHPARLSAAAAARAGGAFADWVMSSGPDFLTRTTTEDVEVLTTFDPRVQRAAEAALRAVFETKLKAGSNAQAAVVVMSPDGAVRAMIGGRDLGAGEGQFNRATQARRQTGSLFKTFVYAAALQAGASPFDPVLDAPLTIYVPGSGRLDAAELHPRLPRADHAGRGAGAVGEHRDGARVRGHRARAGPRRGAGPRRDRPDRRGPGAGARRLGGDAAGDDRRLCRHPERRRPRPALRAARRCG